MPEQVKKIHQFWAGREFPERYRLFQQQWVELNPRWELILWGEDSITDFPHLADVFHSLYERDGGRHGIELFVQAADVMGYALVEKYGGVYVNCDMQPVQPLPTLPDTAWASYENNEDGRIVNAAIGAPEPHDPFWSSLLNALPYSYFANPTDEMVMTTGPGFLTDWARDHPELLHVFPTETFNPVHWKQIEPGGDASYQVDRQSWAGTQTIAVHHWGHKKDRRSNHVETATQ